MHSTICFNGATAEAFSVNNVVKQSFVLATIMFAIALPFLLQYPFEDQLEGVYVPEHRSWVFKVAQLRSKTTIREILIRELLFADYEAYVSYTDTQL